MGQRGTVLLAIASLVVEPAATSQAAEPQERERVFCDVGDPGNSCPGDQCVCVEDTLEVTFDGVSDSVLEYESFEQGLLIETTVMTETRSEQVQAWSFGVEHDSCILSLLDVTDEGTVAGEEMQGGFFAFAKTDIEACAGDDPGCKDPVPASGYLCAMVIMDFVPIPELPIDRNSLCRATYALEADPGMQGTSISFTDRLRRRGSPAVPINFTIQGRSRAPALVCNGWVKRARDIADGGGPAGAAAAFRRGDVDGNGRLNVVDALAVLRAILYGDGTRFDCAAILDVTADSRLDAGDLLALLQYIFARGPALPAPYPECGHVPEGSPTLSCRESNCLGV